MLGEESTSIGSGELEVLEDNAKEAMQDISTTFNTGEFSDFVVKCGSKEFNCHKVVHACRLQILCVESHDHEQHEGE